MNSRIIHIISTVVMVLILVAGLGAVAYISTFPVSGYRFSVLYNGNTLSDKDGESNKVVVDEDGVEFAIRYQYSPLQLKSKINYDFTVEVSTLGTVGYCVDGVSVEGTDSVWESLDLSDVVALEKRGEGAEQSLFVAGDISVRSILEKIYPGKTITLSGPLPEEESFLRLKISSHDGKSVVLVDIRPQEECSIPMQDAQEDQPGNSDGEQGNTNQNVPGEGNNPSEGENLPPPQGVVLSQNKIVF